MKLREATCTTHRLAWISRATHTGLTAAERNFLVSLALNQPKWELLELDHVQHLPALRWKVHNLAQLQKVDPERLQKHAEELRLKLNV